MDIHLDGKRAIVLASSKGIGRASATELAREGANVAISSRSESNLEASKELIVDETGVPRSGFQRLRVISPMRRRSPIR